MDNHHRRSESGGKPSRGGRQVSRRSLLTWLTRGSLAAAAAVAVGQVVRFLSYEPPNAGSSVIPVGSPTDYLSGTMLYVADARCYVGRDGQGLYALDAVCPHLGCLVEQKEEGGFVCPCHDSRFDAEGNPDTGPATKPLRFLSIWLDQDGGQLVIDRSQPMEPTSRLAI